MKIRFRVGAQGKILWKNVKLTLIAVTLSREDADKAEAFLHDMLSVWDQKDLGGGFKAFVRKDPA